MAPGRVVTRVARIEAPGGDALTPREPPTSPSDLLALTVPSALDDAAATFGGGSRTRSATPRRALATSSAPTPRRPCSNAFRSGGASRSPARRWQRAPRCGPSGCDAWRGSIRRGSATMALVDPVPPGHRHRGCRVWPAVRAAMTSCHRRRLEPQRPFVPWRTDVTATYTFDVFSSLDGFAAASANWSGYWGKQGPELLEHRLDLYSEEQRMVFGATTYREFTRMLADSTEEDDVRDPWVTRMWNAPATVVSTTLAEPLDWPNATVASGDAVDVVARLKEESEVPLRSHGSLSMNRAL